jgi:hypothetical protein
VPGQPDYVVGIYEQKGPVDNVFTLMFYKISDPAKFNGTVGATLIVKYDPVPIQFNSSAGVSIAPNVAEQQTLLWSRSRKKHST